MAIGALLLAAGLVATIPDPTTRTTFDDTLSSPVRGVVISTHGAGREWGSDVMAPTFREIRSLGGNWVAIHPYAQIGADGSVRSWPIDPDDPPDWIARPIREAHALGMKILIKPHLAYWGSPFDWRGEIEFEDPDHWRRFWREYEDWITRVAGAAKDADAFVVGTELDRTLDQEAAWRRVIRGVRAATAAPLTYAANWTDYERVPFWDALDLIGIHAYFPVAEAAGAGEAEIRQGWRQTMDRLRRYAQGKGRRIVFAELGYNRSFQAPVEPWAYETDGPEAETIQGLCLRIALEAVEAEPLVIGAFLWKWFPEPHPVGRNFQLATPAMRKVILNAWRGEKGGA